MLQGRTDVCDDSSRPQTLLIQFKLTRGTYPGS